MRTTTLISLVLSLAACGGGGGDDTSNNGMDAGTDTGGTCTRTPAAADRTRYVVVAHPYNANMGASSKFEVLKLTADGTLSRFEPARTFLLGSRAAFGVINFTPDGQLGIVALDNGNLGVFTLDSDGVPTVTDGNFDGAFYADRVVIDPSGDRAWVTDSNTRDNGGGIYSVAINCDGTLTDGARVAPARSPGGLAFSGTNGVFAARDVLDSMTTGNDVHVVDLAATPPSVTAAGDGLPGDDDNILFSGFALSHDGTTAFIGDSSITADNRVAVVGVGATDVTPLAVFTDSNQITDPTSIVASPFGDVAVFTSAQPPGQGIYILDKQGAGSTWRMRGELTYAGGSPQLPGDMVAIEQGQLAGRALVSELSNIRQLAFDSAGNVTDVSSLAFGDGLDEILGAIGVTP